MAAAFAMAVPHAYGFSGNLDFDSAAEALSLMFISHFVLP
jgi:hypothetical protein